MIISTILYAYLLVRDMNVISHQGS